MGTFFSYLGPLANWVLKTSAEASVVIGLVLLAQWLLRKKLSPRWRYGLWLLVLLRLVLPVLPESAFSIFNYVKAARSFAPGATSSEVPPTRNTPDVWTVVPDPASSDTQKPAVVGAPAASAAAVSTPPAPPTAAASPAETAKASGASRSGGPRWSWPVALALAWLTGVLLLAARVAWTPLRLNAQLARQHSAVKPVVLEILEESQQGMGITKDRLPVRRTKRKNGTANSSRGRQLGDNNQHGEIRAGDQFPQCGGMVSGRDEARLHAFGTEHCQRNPDIGELHAQEIRQGKFLLEWHSA